MRPKTPQIKIIFAAAVVALACSYTSQASAQAAPDAAVARSAFSSGAPVAGAGAAVSTPPQFVVINHGRTKKTYPHEVPPGQPPQPIVTATEPEGTAVPQTESPPSRPILVLQSSDSRPSNKLNGNTQLYLNVNNRITLRFSLATAFDRTKLPQRQLKLRDLRLNDEPTAISGANVKVLSDAAREEWVLVSSNQKCASQTRDFDQQSLRLKRVAAKDDCYLGTLTDVRTLRTISGRSPATAKTQSVRAYFTRNSD